MELNIPDVRFTYTSSFRIHKSDFTINLILDDEDDFSRDVVLRKSPENDDDMVKIGYGGQELPVKIVIPEQVNNKVNLGLSLGRGPEHPGTICNQDYVLEVLVDGEIQDSDVLKLNG